MSSRLPVIGLSARFALGISLAMLLFAVAPGAPQTVPSPTAPTVAEDPAKIDQAWQKASAKYDTQRATILKEVDSGDSAGPFRPDWESLQKYEPPDWYKDAKFGIFLHWGVYSVPAFGNEWYPRNMYNEGAVEFKHHIATYGPQDKFGYKDFIPLFKAERFDPAAWARLFKDAGAKYVVPVVEHHDGLDDVVALVEHDALRALAHRGVGDLGACRHSFSR